MLDWNIHHGVGTDGDYNIGRIADWIVKTGANVVSLNEVEKYTGWGNEDQPARFASLLKSKTEKTWYYNFAQRDGSTNGQGNLLLTTFEIESDDDYELSYSRSVARIAIIVNGIRVNLYSTHLDADSSARRSTQMRELKALGRQLSRAAHHPRRLQRLVQHRRDLVDDGRATPTPGRRRRASTSTWPTPATPPAIRATRGIDYVFHSKQASRLKLKRSQVFDVRDSKGVMPSDHRPLMATFDVK